MMRVVESDSHPVSSYVDLIKKVVLLIGDKNLSTCKTAGLVLAAVGNGLGSAYVMCSSSFVLCVSKYRVIISQSVAWLYSMGAGGR